VDRQPAADRQRAGSLIARIAIEHGLILIHNDRDFDHLASVCEDLKCAPSDTQH